MRRRGAGTFRRMFMRGEGEILRDLTTGEERARQAEDQLKHASTAAASQRTQCAELWKAAAALAQEVSGRDRIELQRLIEETDERRQLLKDELAQILKELDVSETWYYARPKLSARPSLAPICVQTSSQLSISSSSMRRR